MKKSLLSTLWRCSLMKDTSGLKLTFSDKNLTGYLAIFQSVSRHVAIVIS